MRHFLAALAALATLLPASAHGPADWIMRGQHKNAAGEWCCGEGDCFVVTEVATVTLPAPGYRLPGIAREDGRERPDDEFIPQSEAQPSPDGQFWRCRWPDGSRRCFFAPPPNS
jgi:hypothetical protein